MSAFLQWLNGANATSLIVALIALFGTFATTVWTNQKADERRREDQVAEDKRRREERWEELLQAEVVRQRGEVSKCVSSIRCSAEETFRSSRESIATYTGRISSGDPIASLEAKAIQGQRRSEFYISAINATERLRLELVHPQVRQCAAELSRILYKESNELGKLHDTDIDEWLNSAVTQLYLSKEVNQAIVELVHSAYEHLHLSGGLEKERIDE